MFCMCSFAEPLSPWSYFFLLSNDRVPNRLTMLQKTLFSAMESVISMMREVEVQEKEVDIVQKEASRGGLDIMVKVEELKQMLAHAKDGNDMVVFCEM